MVASNNITPAYILVGYLWAFLQNNASPLSTINGAAPIVPVQDEPAFEDSGKPYIIYGYSEQFEGHLREIRRGVLSMRVCATSFTELGEITTMISRAFENADVSAANVNLWSTTNSAFVGIRFTNLDVTYIEGGEAPRTEGGSEEGIINIAYNYISQQTVKVFTKNGTWA